MKHNPIRAQDIFEKLQQTAQTIEAEADLRPAVLDILKAELKKGHLYAQAKLESQHLRGSTCAEFLCRVQDEILTALCNFTKNYIVRLSNPTDSEQLSVVAVGGYGRGYLAPASDIDLLFLLPYKRNAACETFVEYILYMLWDMGLKVGHATRSVTESIAQAEKDMVIRTSLLEARLLWGNEALFTAFQTEFHKKIIRNSARQFVEAKLQERDMRHEKTGRSRYLVEPNIKEGKGGLRDLNTLFWIAKYCYQLTEIDELVARGLLTAQELALFKRCYNFLWAVRCHLHFLTGRAEERLSFDVQKELAMRMGVKATTGLNPVEKFMRRYFLVAKDVGDLTAIFCATLEEEQKKRRPITRLPRLFQRQKNLHGFKIVHGRLTMANQDCFAKDAVNLIRVFHLADKYGLDIHPVTTREITRNVRLIDATLRRDKTANELFLQILCSHKNPEYSLRRMNETGVLGRFIPDFGHIVALMQFNMYHHYTADEHLLRAIGMLAEIEKGVHAEDSFAHDLFAQGIDRKVIYLAMFLHDIAKGRPEDHSLLGGQIAKRLAPRFGFTQHQTQLVIWLVEQHLTMSDIAQRRDLSDTQTIQDFVNIVQNSERLKHLYVLTIADIRAVGPGTWNSWKAQLMRTLYDETDTVLTAGGRTNIQQNRVMHAKQNFIRHVTNTQNPTVTQAQIDRFIARQQDSYWLGIAMEEQIIHMRLLETQAEQDIIIDIHANNAKTVSIVTLICPDRAGLFAQLAGAVALSGSNILDARIATTRDGFALDTLYLQTTENKILTTAQKQQLIQKLKETVSHNINPATIIRQANPVSSRMKAFDIAPKVDINNNMSQHASVIEISTRNRQALLYDLSCVLFKANITILSARVASFGERAVDIFYVQNKAGQKITNANQRAKLIAKLNAVITHKAALKGKQTEK